MERYAIYGAGGYGKVVMDLIHKKKYELECVFDDRYVDDYPEDVKIERYSPDTSRATKIIISIGNNEIREKVAGSIQHEFGNLIHPRAVVAADVDIDEGTVILANVVVLSSVSIGKHVVINANAVIDHDAIVHDFSYIGANVYVGGGAIIGKGADIGPGSIIMRNAVVPDNAKVPPLSIIEK